MGESTETATAPETPTPTAPTTEPAAPAAPASTPEPAQAGPKPPWGSDAEFNPEKAWNLVTNLRSELGDVKANLEKSRKDASEIDLVRVQAQEAAAAKTEADLALLRSEAARNHGLNGEQFEFLSELTTAEAIEQRALKLAAMNAESARPVDPAQGHTTAQSGPSQLTREDMTRMSPEEIVEAEKLGRFDELQGRK